MGIVSWILLGIVAGVVIVRFTGQRNGTGYLMFFVVGIIGAVAGGFAANLVMRFPPVDFTWASFFVAILGAGIFLFLTSVGQQR
ncbi:GlsB/YeaQ/YmgE family stress response membrane protein [Litorilinea aerophila]|uniref:GlsB/YeaQ/YmgE family stress response membrane protein n=1 Tax=Litorilinea aerophila TaxID=1204385 RepID=A0A540VAX3_9CHLR|nr:GlsB/YeaQ/YmgE family stress response membrane protein [Litorilinea aerophila]MCC9078185.1 GlsB/YeaQ/YmgE family stress response membrane protein [Litorilinea aerophila]OUC09674.1 hypothetical protein RY27_01400 [Litorilinea aerophila]GIV80153.1 MAG: hypothetical protein KatS3mg050_4547 [Litorilinea sp.]